MSYYYYYYYYYYKSVEQKYTWPIESAPSAKLQHDVGELTASQLRPQQQMLQQQALRVYFARKVG